MIALGLPRAALHPEKLAAAAPKAGGE